MRHVELKSFPPLEGRTHSLSEALDSAGVTPASFHGPAGLAFDVGNFDTDGRINAIGQHRKHLQFCASLGAAYYVIHPGFDNYWKNGGGTWDDEKKTATFPRVESTIGRLWETNASSLAELADFAADLGVRIALETGPPNIMTPAETMQVVRLANKKNVGVCVDTGHVNVGAVIKPSDAIRQIGRLTWTLHLNDNHGDGDFHLPPGKGNIDWAAVAKALSDAGYDGALNIELSPADWKKEDAWMALKEGVLFLQDIFG